MNITYTKKGDYNYPDLVYSKNDYPPLGKYGMLRKTYLIENFKAQYSLMLMNDTLWPHLLDIDKQAHDMMDIFRFVLFHGNTEVIAPLFRQIGAFAFTGNKQLEVVQLEQKQEFAVTRCRFSHDLIPVLRVPAHQIEELCCKELTHRLFFQQLP